MKHSCVEHDASDCVSVALSIGPADLSVRSKSEPSGGAEHLETVYARFRSPGASVQPPLATAEPLLPPLAGPLVGVALERQPSMVVVPVEDVAVSVVTAASHVSTPCAP